MTNKNIRKGLLLITLFTGTAIFAQDKIYISRSALAEIFRVNAAATHWRMTETDSAARVVTGVHLSNELKLISAYRDHDKKLSFYDAFYFDINMGKMTSERHIIGDEKESRFSIVTNMGYLVAAGFRNEKWSALGGIDFRFSRNSAGGSDMPNLNGPLFYFYKPVIARGEYALRSDRPEQRIALMTWSTLNTKKPEVYRSARLELGFEESGNWWMFVQYTYQHALMQDNFRFSDARNGTFNQFIIGIRKGLSP